MVVFQICCPDCDSIAVRRSRREKKQSGATSALEKIRYVCVVEERDGEYISLALCTQIPPFFLSSFSSFTHCVPPPPSSSHSRRSRETGVHEEAELEVPRAVFDYVDEDEYARIVQERQEEGFVLDDGGWSQGHHATDIISSSTYQVVYQ